MTEPSVDGLRRARNAVAACGHAKGPTDACRQCIARAIDEAVAENVAKAIREERSAWVATVKHVGGIFGGRTQ